MYSLVSKNKHGNKGDFYCENITNNISSIQKNTFDFVIALGIIHHLNDNDALILIEKAKNYLKKRVSNRKVRLKLYGTDRFNRQLAEVFVDGKNINLELLRKGLAEVYQGRKPEALDKETYLKMEAMAKKEKQAIWQLGKSYKSPKQWRKENPRK